MADLPTDERPFERGDVVWHRGLFKRADRPWFVLSDDRHPFHGQEYVVIGITTTEREEAIQLAPDDWAVGGLPRTSYASPWFLTTLKHADVDRGVGTISESTTDEIVTEALAYFQ